MTQERIKELEAKIEKESWAYGVACEEAAELVRQRTAQLGRIEDMKKELAALKSKPEWTEIGSSMLWQIHKCETPGYEIRYGDNSATARGISTDTIAALAKFAGLRIAEDGGCCLSKSMVERLRKLDMGIFRGGDSQDSAAHKQALAREVLQDGGAG